MSSLLRRTLLPRAGFFAPTAAFSARSFQSGSRQLARKDTQDKDSINTESNEYSKSGGDEAAAATEDAAFNPDKTSPEEEHATAGRESSGDSNNPLDVSPANPEVSKPRGQQEGGAEGSADETGSGSGRQRTSGGGSPNKSGGGKSGGSGSGV